MLYTSQNSGHTWLFNLLNWRLATASKEVLQTNIHSALIYVQYICIYLFDFDIDWRKRLKGIVHPKMKITPWFTDPQVIIGAHCFLLSDKYNWSYIKKNVVQAYNGSKWGLFLKSNEVHKSIIKSTPSGSGGVNKGLLKWINVFVGKYTYLKLYKL